VIGSRPDANGVYFPHRLGLQRRRDLLRGLDQRRDQRRHRIAQRDHQANSVGHERIDNRNRPDGIRQAERIRELLPASR